MKTHYFLVIFLSVIFFAESNFAADRIEPPCPPMTSKFRYPDNGRHNWFGCKNGSHLFDGIIAEYTNQGELFRIASVAKSQRNGREIRSGKTGEIEERTFKNGKLHGPSFIFKSDAPVGRWVKKKPDLGFWQDFLMPPKGSIFEALTKIKPFSTLQFDSGRLTEAQFGKVTHRFKITPEGRMLATDHPEMKNLFFFDPALLVGLEPDDVKKLLIPGFGSCAKYSGPIGKFGRNLGTLYFRRERNEDLHYVEMQNIFNRFKKFCFPNDLEQNLGVLECPPQLPNEAPPQICFLPVSDQIHIPYDHKSFQFRWTHKLTPEAFIGLLMQNGLIEFLAAPAKKMDQLEIKGESWKVDLRRTKFGILFRPTDAEGGKVDWWTWHPLPGHF